MALTQNQLDEAMKPPRFDTHVTSIGDHTSSVGEPSMPSSSIMTKDKKFSSTANPINSLLAGEKIQFGELLLPQSCFIDILRVCIFQLEIAPNF